MLVAQARAMHRQAAVAQPVKVSFGSITTRNAVLLILEDDAGYTGIGESWINFPAWAPWERVAAFEQAIIPYLLGQQVDDIPAFVASLYRAFRGPAVQSGTVGPLLSAVCGVELALWDLEAKRQGVPLNRLWFANPAARVRLYASGINHPIPWEAIDALLDRGVSLFKLKMGFGDDVDRKNLADLTRYLAARASVAVDVNRAWSLEQALRWVPILADHGVAWLEEPLTVAEEPGLSTLHARRQVPISGAENVLMEPGVDTEALAVAPLDIFQPDITKYCPAHVALILLQAVHRRGLKLYPHFLGSAPGQAAVFHLASGCGESWVEWDINPNPLRTELLVPPFDIQGGMVQLPNRPGLGWDLPL